MIGAILTLLVVLLGLCCVVKLVEMAGKVCWLVTKNVVLPGIGLAIL